MSKILIEEATVKLALEALEGMAQDLGKFPGEVPAIRDFKEALAPQPAQHDDIHSCSPFCDRPMCVAVREAVLAEREVCARVADKISDKYGWGYSGNEVDTADEIAAAIRARGQA